MCAGKWYVMVTMSRLSISFANHLICSFNVFAVPDNFHSVLKNYTRKGYRVIAAAFRPLPASINYTKMQRLSREEVETDLILLGLIVLENKLKPETTPVISKLKDAKLRIVIVTGAAAMRSFRIHSHSFCISKCECRVYR